MRFWFSVKLLLALPAAALAEDPLLHFAFNEGTGTQVFNLGTQAANATLTLSNGTAFSAAGEGVTGAPGDFALSMIAADAMGDLATTDPRATNASSSQGASLVSFTIAGWFKTQNGEVLSRSARLVDLGGGNLQLFGSPTGNLTLGLPNSTSFVTSGAPYSASGEWVFFAVTFDGSKPSAEKAAFYVGGLSRAVERVVSSGGGPATSTTRTRLGVGNLGAQSTAVRPFRGWLDEVQIFGSSNSPAGALSAEAIEALRLTVAHPPEPTPPMHYKLFILAGQSNASGRSSAAGGALPPDPLDETVGFFYDTDTTGAFSNIRTSGGVFTTLAPTPNGIFGPEMGIGRVLAAQGVARPAMIKFSRGGTSLFADWDPNATSGHQLYAQLLQRIEAATTFLKERGHSYTWGGFFWMQGESDGSQSAAYQANLETLIARLREDLDAPHLPFVLGRVGVVNTNPASPNRLEVRAAQVAVAEADPLGAWVDTDDLERFDGTHYDAPGTLLLGERMGAAFLDLPPTNYRAWLRRSVPLEERADPEIAAPGADAAASGVPNLVRYYLGLPANARVAPGDLPAAALEEGGNRLFLSYWRNRYAGDAPGVVEWSVNLIDWHSSEVEIEVTEVEPTRERVSASLPRAGRAALYLRLRVRDQVVPLVAP